MTVVVVVVLFCVCSPALVLDATHSRSLLSLFLSFSVLRRISVFFFRFVFILHDLLFSPVFARFLSLSLFPSQVHDDFVFFVCVALAVFFHTSVCPSCLLDCFFSACFSSSWLVFMFLFTSRFKYMMTSNPILLFNILQTTRNDRRTKVNQLVNAEWHCQIGCVIISWSAYRTCV